MKWVLLLGIAGIAMLIGIGYVFPKPPEQGERIRVVTSFYPLAEFAAEVGGNRVTVSNITEGGIEPHDFEPTPADVVKIHSANLFIFNGSGFDPWAKKMQPELEKKGIAVLPITERFELIAGTPEENDEGRKGEVRDPHIWLDPVLAGGEVEIIRDALGRIDPNHAAEYEARAKEYLLRLTGLHETYQIGLTSCALQDIVVSHTAFEYLAKRYGIRMIPIAGISPEEEPSPRQLTDIAKLAREKRIGYIFFETLASPKLAETIANEVGAQTLVLNPIEGLTREEAAQGETYLSLMEENLNTLRIALECA